MVFSQYLKQCHTESYSNATTQITTDPLSIHFPRDSLVTPSVFMEPHTHSQTHDHSEASTLVMSRRVFPLTFPQHSSERSAATGPLQASAADYNKL